MKLSAVTSELVVSAREADTRSPTSVPQEWSQDHKDRNKIFAERLHGKLILAPLTRGNHLPFRQLCAELGADVTMSEMAFARMLLKNNVVEKARLRIAGNEGCYGLQVATNNIAEGVGAAKMAADAGCTWLDLNVGCPIYEASRRGLGAVLLRKPAKLARLVAGIAAGSPLPLTVKIRTGESSSKINCLQVVEALQDCGPAAISIHGRTMEQRYKRAADWDLIAAAARSSAIPIIGNGDILTLYEAQRRLQGTGCWGLMSGRGALIKPWIFTEFQEGREMLPNAAERVGIYHRLVTLMKEYFGGDDKGRKKAFYFLPWHFNFFCRYRPYPQELYSEQSLEHPLIGTRADVSDSRVGETPESLPLLERLLRCSHVDAHSAIAENLWDSTDHEDAIRRLEHLATASLELWEQSGQLDDREDAVAEG
ncbi:hypothetical protein WJX84_011334 [Apatococcus fuscideae]|uniref:tRNA-dihydrouridine(47) synthase [NAD(P)(+)] n=1 Tax=Apatococcus fuscideae TaxID=2026836 RepID=A0AAW1TGS3_9CHLO